MNEKLVSLNTSEISAPKRLVELVKRPQLSLNFFKEYFEDLANNISDEYSETVEIYFKYEEFIQKQKDKMFSLKKLEKIKLLEEIDYEEIKSLRKEAREQLNKIKPKTLGQASRIFGVNPADIAVLKIWLEAKRN